MPDDAEYIPRTPSMGDDAGFIPRTPSVPGPPPPEPEPDHEHSDVYVRGLVYFFVAMAFSGVALHFLFLMLFRIYTGHELPSHAAQAEVSVQETTGFSRAPAPRLQVVPANDMANWRAYEQHELDTYGWVDRGTGVVRIPIDEAIKLTAQRLGKPERRPP